MRRLRHCGVIGALTTMSVALAPFVARAQAPLQVLDVPFVSQSEALCGGAAAAMVLRFWGERGVTAESFAHLLDQSAAGIRTSALTDDLRRRGWNVVGVEGTSDLLTRELSQGRPVIALIEDRPGAFHYVVLVASTPTAVLFHDPARAPFRGMPRDQFDRRWLAADRWMAVVLPGAERPAAAVSPVGTRGPGVAGSACQAIVAEASRLTAAGEFEPAERALTSGAACSASVTFRELAGVRAMQRRWPEAGELAASAVEIDPADEAAWRLLATSRFLQDDRPGALGAWNEVGEPRLDTLQVDGLRRTRVPVAIQAARVRQGDLITHRTLTHVERRLAAVPALTAAAVEYVPAPRGLADLRARVTERTLWPTSPVALSGIGVRALVSRTFTVPIGSFSGGGERVDLQWRFWPGRPRVAVDYSAPAPWRGVWGVGASWEKQPFDSPVLQTSERNAAHVSWSDWVAPAWRVGVRSGVDKWMKAQGPRPEAQEEPLVETSIGTMGMAGVSLEGASPSGRLRTQISVDSWWSDQPFTVTQGLVRAQSSTARQGVTLLGQIGAALAGDSTPPDLWFGGDTGRARPVLLRAHRLVVNGEMRTDQIGRAILHGSGEGQYWWRAGRVRVAGAIFVDMVSLERRPFPGRRGDVDAGAGIRVGLPGASGTLRLDAAKGLRDGRFRVSVGFEP